MFKNITSPGIGDGGASGGGKSEALIWSAARFRDLPDYRGLILRRTFPQLQEIIDRCFKYYPQTGATYRATEHRWHWPSGATIKLGHMQHPNDRYNYLGAEFNFLGFDELTQFLESMYIFMFSRLRTTDPNSKTRLFGDLLDEF